MCQIIVLEPGKNIPDDKLAVTCDINKHGYGLAYSKNGKLTVIRSLVEPNDPKALQETLKGLDKYRRFLHLRHATVGDVSQQNNHPFVILKSKKGDPELLLMHNGTLYDYKPTDEKTDKRSDTLHFVEKFVQPLAARCNAFGGPDKLLEDPILIRTINKENSYTSVIVLIDAKGRHLRFNEKEGKVQDFGWVSNEYSFNPNHGRATTHHQQYRAAQDNFNPRQQDAWWNRGGDSLDGIGEKPWEPPRQTEYQMADWEKELETNTRRNPIGIPIIAVTDQDKKKLEREVKAASVIGVMVKRSKGVEMRSKIRMQFVARKTFVQKMGLSSLDDVYKLTARDLKELCEDHPDAMADLVIDLLDDRVKLKRNNDQQAQVILDGKK